MRRLDDDASSPLGSRDSSADEREQKAYRRGRREQEIDGRLDGHDRHLYRHDEEIRVAAQAQIAIQSQLSSMKNEMAKGDELRELKSQVATTEQVDDALKRARWSRGDRIAVAAMFALLLGSVLTSILDKVT